MRVDSAFCGGYLTSVVSTKGASMTDLLKKAFDAISALPPERQNAMAKMILAEIKDEEQWDKAFAASQDKLAALADEAVAEHMYSKRSASSGSITHD
jgi:hypothetical protein